MHKGKSVQNSRENSFQDLDPKYDEEEEFEKEQEEKEYLEKMTNYRHNFKTDSSEKHSMSKAFRG